MRLISFVCIMAVFTAFPFVIQAQSSCSYPNEVTTNQLVEPDEALEHYYRERNRGLLYGHEESLKKAIQYFRGKDKKDREEDDKKQEFQLLSALVDYYIFAKKSTSEIRKVLSEIKALADNENNPIWQATALMLWANVELGLAQNDRLFDPIGVYQQALVLAAQKDIKLTLLEVQIENNILQAKFILNRNKQGKLQMSKLDFDRPLERIKTLWNSGSADKVDIARQAVKFGFLAINQPDLEIQFLGEKALKLVKDEILKGSLEELFYAYAYGYLGEFYLKQKKLTIAQEHLENAIFYNRQQENSVTLLYYWHWQLAKLYSEQGNIEEAIKHYKIAVEYLKSVRRAIFNTLPVSQLKLLAKDDDLFKDYADLLFREAEKLETGEEQQTLLLTALNAIEQLKATKLQNHFEDECIADLNKEINAQTLPKILSTNTLAFYPIMFKNRIVLLLASVNKQDEKMNIYLSQTVVSEQKIVAELKKLQSKTNFSITNVDKLLNKYIDMLNKRPNSRQNKWSRFVREYTPVSNALYQLLIEPIFDKIKNYQVLVIIPNEKLSTIPFAALYSKDRDEQLIKTIAITSAVNLGLIKFNALDVNKRFLFGGLSEAQGKFPKLEYVKLLHGRLKEKQFYGMGEVSFLNQNFIQKNLKNSLSNDEKEFDIIHIATHAVFESVFTGRFLVAHNEHILMSDFEAMIGNKIRQQPLNLLVLSACNTATGDENAVLGLAGVAIKARASSVLGSLWAVPAEETGKLMIDFYDKLLKDETIDSKASAWQQTQIEYLDNNTGTQHPYYWAGFILIGSW
ncbi:MAG: CHAT domain-containing protein [Thiotrichaceae bacterium]|nr:CHAT domain-containing protein [Thiotrichaceae bacterium]